MQTTNTTTPAQRVRAAFEAARAEDRGVLIPYFMCGYPSAGQSAQVVLAAAEAGADLIELGLPFSDPLADGATIQHAGHQALLGGNDHARLPGDRPPGLGPLGSTADPDGLLHPCWPMAWSAFARTLPPVGLWPDHSRSASRGSYWLQKAAIAAGLTLIFLIPPTTPDERIAQVARVASEIPGSFIYCVSLSGVTGATSKFEILPGLLHRIYIHAKPLNLPVVVGFGLTEPDHITFISGLADGSVVGTALIKLLDKHAEGEQVEAVKAYIGSLRAATSRV